MIGVVAPAEERDAACEFFELFKTPWEFVRKDAQYDVLIDAGVGIDNPAAPLVVVYGSRATAFDDEHRTRPGRQHRNVMLSHAGAELPVYGSCLAFPADGTSRHVVLEAGEDSFLSVGAADGKTFIRVGYDLFREVGFLLTTGQPAEHARIPTLERHIALLRDCIVDAGIPLVEVPPVPDGYRFTVCLTHDVDHAAIRLHKLDHTTFGFLYRAVIGSLIAVCTRRAGLATLKRNVAAAFALPFVHLGWVKDFWEGFHDYLRIERGLGSTFFVIPVKGDPGHTAAGEAPKLRATSYDVEDIALGLEPVAASGCEIALHGIDAWLDSARGTAERERIARVTETTTTGVRMHWLFWDDKAPQRLEEAGFAYDSTFGYNDTIGFRAGTLQAFKPFPARRLLELPLTIMDTALFYPAYLNLTQHTAGDVVWPVVSDAERYGGIVVINWHDRSLAPERLWGGFYAVLLDHLRGRSAWFPTAGRAAAWFRQRRSVVFDRVQWDGASVRVSASADTDPTLPGLTLRIHRPRRASDDAGPDGSPLAPRFVDVSFNTATADIYAPA